MASTTECPVFPEALTALAAFVGEATGQPTRVGRAGTAAALTAPADKTFQIKFDNEDASVQHNVEIKDASGKVLFKGDLVTGVTTTTYTVPAIPAGTYPFQCTVHPNMTGTLTVK